MKHNNNTTQKITKMNEEKENEKKRACTSLTSLHFIHILFSFIISSQRLTGKWGENEKGQKKEGKKRTPLSFWFFSLLSSFLFVSCAFSSFHLVEFVLNFLTITIQPNRKKKSTRNKGLMNSRQPEEMNGFVFLFLSFPFHSRLRSFFTSL